MNRLLKWILILAVIATGCTVYKEYPIDVYKPGEVNVPSNVKNIALVYRDFKYKNDTLQHFYKDDYELKKAKGDPKNLDSILVSSCLQELAANLKEHNNYNRIHIFPDIFKLHSGNKLPVLDFDMVKKITAASETDLLISLESFSYFYSEYETDENVPASREVITAAAWGVYDPVTEKVLERKTMIDTAYWNAYDENGNYQNNSKLPPRLMALRIASQMAGENYSKRFYATWQSVLRMYSIPPLPDFEAAEKYIQKNDWDNAILLWKRYADDKNGKLAINARYNLALAYEMKDDIDTAWKWLAAAKQIASDYRSKNDMKMITKYQNVLAKRKEQIDRLNNE